MKQHMARIAQKLGRLLLVTTGTTFLAKCQLHSKSAGRRGLQLTRQTHSCLRPWKYGQRITKLLRNEDESGCLVVGDLIIYVFLRAGDSALAVFPELLHAVVERMLTAKTAAFLQSLLIVTLFVSLIHNQVDTVLSPLESTRMQERKKVPGFLSEEVQLSYAIPALCVWSTLAEILMVKGDITNLEAKGEFAHCAPPLRPLRRDRGRRQVRILSVTVHSAFLASLVETCF
ncbi:hypothetical protein JVU11DRAFT_4656 [Chiua virens]|nr:hypothetical protein JVU11DRAFT_4656 [Chiua virens]